MEVKLDKALYRQMRESMKEWDDAKMRARVREAHTLTHAELWRQYADLWEFGMKFAQPTNKAQQAREMEEWADAYRKLEKLEAWRKAHGKKT
jgi:hypothetical protein